MIKLVRFLLPVCILLLSGYTQQSGHVYRESLCQSPIKNEEVVLACYDSAPDCQELIIRSGLSDTERENGLNHLANLEEKEDELASFKKFIEFSNDLAAGFYTYIPAQFSQYTIRSLIFFKHYTYFPTYRSLFLRFKVLRIWYKTLAGRSFIGLLLLLLFLTANDLIRCSQTAKKVWKYSVLYTFIKELSGKFILY